MRQQTKVALVTGANRGIGLEVVRQLATQGMQVVLGARDPLKGEAAAQPLIQAGLAVFPHQLDVTEQDSIDRLRAQVAAQFGRLDILANNAAILYDTWQQATTADLKVVHTALETNLFGAWRMCQAVLPLLRRSDAGRIVNVSSEGGSLTSMGGGTPAYSLSKAALNALTRLLAAELSGTKHLPSICKHPSIGLDVGLTSFLTESEGHTIPHSRNFRKSQRTLRHKQQQMGRRKKDSNRSRKATKREAWFCLGRCTS